VGKSETLEDVGVDVSIIVIWNFKKGNVGLDGIDLAQDRDR